MFCCRHLLLELSIEQTPAGTLLARPPPAYDVVGVGNFNGDGSSDVLFRNNITGDTGFYAVVNVF